MGIDFSGYRSPPNTHLFSRLFFVVKIYICTVLRLSLTHALGEINEIPERHIYILKINQRIPHMIRHEQNILSFDSTPLQLSTPPQKPNDGI